MGRPYLTGMIGHQNVRISLLLLSENDTYGIMQDTMTNTLIDSSDFDGRIDNVRSTTPYDVCISLDGTPYPSDCELDLSQKVSMSRIVKMGNGDIAPMSIIIFNDNSR